MTRYPDMIAHVRQRPLEIPLGDGFRAACWNGPRTFDAQSERAIYGAIVEMASAVFGSDMSPYWRRRAREGYLDNIAKLFIIYDEDGALVGWTGYHRVGAGDRRTVYADATGVLPRARRFGLMRKIMTWCFVEELARNRFRPVYWAMRTESPVVYYAFRESFGEESVYPRAGAEAPPHVRAIGAAIAAWLKQGDRYRPASMRIENAFDGPCPWRFTPDVKPLPGGHLESPDARVNTFFRQHLRPEDAFIIIARNSTENMVRLTSLALRAQMKPLLERS